MAIGIAVGLVFMVIGVIALVGPGVVEARIDGRRDRR